MMFSLNIFISYKQYILHKYTAVNNFKDKNESKLLIEFFSLVGYHMLVHNVADFHGVLYVITSNTNFAYIFNPTKRGKNACC